MTHGVSDLCGHQSIVLPLLASWGEVAWVLSIRVIRVRGFASSLHPTLSCVWGATTTVGAGWPGF